MIEVKTQKDLELFGISDYDLRLFCCELLQVYGARCLDDPAPYLPKSHFATFLERADDLYFGFVANGRAALVKLDAETVRAIVEGNNERN